MCLDSLHCLLSVPVVRIEYVYYEKLISDFTIFNEDIEYINEQHEKVNHGYEIYCEGRHSCVFHR